MTTRRRVAIVTGASSGIGRACAVDLSSDHDVVIVARREAQLRETLPMLASPASYVAADTAELADVQRVIDTVLTRHGRVDVLVHAAGERHQPLTLESPLDDAVDVWDRVVATNARSGFLLGFGLAPHLTRPGGRVVLVSSAGAFTGGRAGMLAYAASKCALHGVAQGLALMLSPEGVTVNVVVPGMIAGTGMTDTLPDHVQDAYAREILVRRVGRPEDVAATVRFLCSPGAGYITGELVLVTGGSVFGR